MARRQKPPPILPVGAPQPLKPGYLAAIRTYFLTGLIVAGPVAITIYLTWSFVTWVDGWVTPLIPASYLPETYLPFQIPGFGLIVALIGLTLVGFLTANLVGRTLVRFGENLLDRMPVVRGIYKALKQVFATVFSQSGTSFRKAGLVEFPQGRLVGRLHFGRAEPVDRALSAWRGRRLGVGVHALRPQSDDRLLLPVAALQGDRAADPRRGSDQARDFGRPDPAGIAPTDDRRRKPRSISRRAAACTASSRSNR